MEYIIGIDAGGTKTNAALYDVDGRVLFETGAGYGNMLVNPDVALGNIIAAASACVAARPAPGPAPCPAPGPAARPAHRPAPGAAPGAAHIYIGAAGIAAEGNERKLAVAMGERFPDCPVRIVTDAVLALYALTKGRDGVLVIAGTGSIAYGKRAGTQLRAGGWGHILGDEGGGYYISRRAFSNITAEYDAGAGYSLLSQRMLEKLGADIFGMIKFVYGASKGEIAGFLPTVAQAAADGDTFAISLLREAGQYLASLAVNLRGRLGFTGPAMAVIKGGVLENIQIVRDEFVRGLAGEEFIMSLESAPSELGAYYMHLEKFPRE